MNDWTPKTIADAIQSPIVKRFLLHSQPEDLLGGEYESFSVTSIRENGCSGPSVGISWVPLTQNIRAPRVEMFCDTWLAFTELRDIFDALSKLDSHLLEDRTVRVFENPEDVKFATPSKRFELKPERVKAALLNLGIEEIDRNFNYWGGS